MKINVLWIDDQPNNAFIDNANNEGIYIEVRKNVDAGIDELVNSSTSYEAIILDANCISHDDGSKEPDISALGYALRKITENKIEIPWFVYSGGGFSGEESIEITVKAYERAYDDNDWYKKPSEKNELFAKINSVVPEFESFKIKNKYSDIFSWYPNSKELLIILSFLEQGKFNDPSIFNLIRKELDWVMNYSYDCGLLQEPYKGSNLAECSSFLGNKNLQDIVPLHIQRSLHSTSSICNEGSHRLVIDKLVREGKAPYLVSSTTLEFLNILYWLKDMPNTPEGKKSLKAMVIEMLKSPEPDSKNYYENKEFIVEQDNKNNYHCGQCRLSYKKAQEFLGKPVILYGITENDAKSADNYPYFANFRPKQSY